MALVEGCKHSLEITVPVEEVEAETGRAVAKVQQRAKLKGFRPGKAPTGIIRQQFAGEIREQVLEALIPKHLQNRMEAENLKWVGKPDITEVHLEPGEPLRFKAEFEVVPQIELQDYKDLSVPYHDPQVTDEDVNQRIEELRQQKAEFVNEDPRPLQDGDHAAFSLESLSGVEGAAIKQDEMTLEIGGADTMEDFTQQLRGMSPGEEKEFDVHYAEDYGQEKLAGKTVRFRAQIKAVRRKELPEVNDEFAQDLGDYRTVDELRDAVRKSLFAQRQFAAQEEAKNKLVDKLVDMHDFPVPEAFVDQQIRNRTERALAAQGVDTKGLRLDWKKVKETQQEKAVREVKASMLLGRIAEREAIAPTREEVDREVERIARQQREPFAAVRLRFEKDGTLGRIASHIQTEKTLNFLFEHAGKTEE
ncbi:MAG TPA: trigger factor [Bryobacteraceae bacterium]|nr:trigger factor [Bryobacteraceae bacterium]